MKEKALSDTELLEHILVTTTVICKNKGWGRKRIKDIIDETSTKWDEKEKEKKWRAL